MGEEWPTSTAETVWWSGDNDNSTREGQKAMGLEDVCGRAGTKCGTEPVAEHEGTHGRAGRRTLWTWEGDWGT